MALFREENTLLVEKSPMDDPRLRFITYGIIILLTSIIYVLTIRFISVASVTPDLLLIICLWIVLREGQLIGTIVAFSAGLLFDIVSADTTGTNALAKVIAIFLAGFWYNENLVKHNIGSYKFLLITGLCTFIHNLVYFFFYLRPAETSFGTFFLKYGIAATLYTTVIASIPMLIASRKSEF